MVNINWLMVNKKHIIYIYIYIGTKRYRKEVRTGCYFLTRCHLFDNLKRLNQNCDKLLLKLNESSSRNLLGCRHLPTWLSNGSEWWPNKKLISLKVSRLETQSRLVFSSVESKEINSDLAMLLCCSGLCLVDIKQNGFARSKHMLISWPNKSRHWRLGLCTIKLVSLWEQSSSFPSSFEKNDLSNESLLSQHIHGKRSNWFHLVNCSNVSCVSLLLNLPPSSDSVRDIFSKPHSSWLSILSMRL